VNGLLRQYEPSGASARDENDDGKDDGERRFGIPARRSPSAFG